MIDRLDHLVLTVRDLEATCQFYERVLGMQVVTFDHGRRALHFGQQKINLHLAGHEFEPKARHPQPGSADLCLIAAVPLEQVMEKLTASGVAIEVGPVYRTGAAGPIRSVYVRDPDHNLIEVAEYVQAAEPLAKEAAVTEISRVLQQRPPGIMGAQQVGEFGILLPLVKMDDGKLGVLFEKRASTMRRQANEICFPGGRAEKSDESKWATARRETSEELGVPPENIHFVGELDWLTGPGRAVIYPFVGFVEGIADMKPNPDEVGEVFVISLERLAAAKPSTYTSSLVTEPEEDFPYHLIPGGKRYPWRTGKVEHLFYELDGRVIWGLTARVLAHFLERLPGEGWSCK
ncbi:VOC family protein [Brevibacillus gelatini]|uniref:NUDIX domain-containing protein n=1 Tax=Brevibacillus gelatini TaxID=1655277 RepID=A0A3M8ANI8_9BACL|nr:VOC family protein [Brevibacillus gelatini]RNB52768.1 NUDIX domain-containing protein [Brevibacillus gelatini]